MQEMARVFAEMQQSVASAERIFSLKMQCPMWCRQARCSPNLAVLVGEIIFDNVSFCLRRWQAECLSDFNLHVEQGEMIALVGPDWWWQEHDRQSALHASSSQRKATIRHQWHRLHAR
jgi:ATP-binding cassette subfamily B protein